MVVAVTLPPLQMTLLTSDSLAFLDMGWMQETAHCHKSPSFWYCRKASGITNMIIHQGIRFTQDYFVWVGVRPPFSCTER